VAVSIVLASRNYGRYLPQAIGSVREQTFGDWECIVVDDGSTDDSMHVLGDLAAVEPRVRVFSQARAGVSAARNAALDRASGEFIQFLDADDLLHPGKLETHVHALRQHSHLDGVLGPTAPFGDGEGPPPGWRDRSVAPADASVERELDLETLLIANPMTIEAPIVRRSTIQRIGGFDERLRLMEDWDLWLRCVIDGGRFAFFDSPTPVALIRVHEGSASRRVSAMLTSEIQVRRKVAKALTRGSDRALNDRRIDDARARAGWLIGTAGDPVAGLRYLVPATASRWRFRWLLWVAALLLMRVPGGSALVRVTREAMAERRAKVPTDAR
jgi:glycosyltransferase involved in cell wall biosynthesis